MAIYPGYVSYDLALGLKGVVKKNTPFTAILIGTRMINQCMERGKTGQMSRCKIDVT